MSVASGVAMVTAGCLGSNGDSEYEVDVIDRSSDDAVADYHGHWHGELPSISLEDNVSLGAVFEDEDGEAVDLGGEYSLDVEPTDEAIVSAESHGDHVHLYGESAGETTVTFQLFHDDHVEWETSEAIDVEVLEE
ncbi:hypothetical protein [Natrarchaeobaculum sulfurireducens]|nr:hypothetical protein [Natrarchaeobaculum sulfurireducens]